MHPRLSHHTLADPKLLAFVGTEALSVLADWTLSYPPLYQNMLTATVSFEWLPEVVLSLSRVGPDEVLGGPISYQRMLLVGLIGGCTLQ